MSHAMLTVKWHGLGYAPVIIGPQGCALTDVLAWTISEKRAGKSDSTLYSQAHAVKRFADFWEHYHGQVSSADLYRSCFEKLVHGNKPLGWKGVDLKSATRYLEYINRFATWAAEQKGVNDPNPMVEERGGWIKTLARMGLQRRSSMLGHLLPATRAGQGIIAHRQINPARTSQRTSVPTVNQEYKAMLWDDYMTLLRHEQSMRNLLLWLMLGAGGLRISEAVHLFVQDVRATIDGEARVLLTDPRYGQIAIPCQSGGKKVMTREAYLKEYFGLTTRDQLKPRSTLYAGWKGMRVHDGKTMTAEIIWLHPDFGKMAWAAHRSYLAIRRLTDAKHPYYFVNIDYNGGNPLTISNANGLLKDVCARLNILSAQNLHSLRHLFGDTLHNRGGAELDKVQVAMRHKNSTSTETYTRPLVELVRERLKQIDMLRPQIGEKHEP